MANVIELLIRAQDQASKELDSVKKSAGGLSDAMGPLKDGLKIAGAALAAAGVASVKMAGDFEQSLNVFKSVSGATAEQMALVSAKARELGKDAALPGVSAKDAAFAMSELAKAGLSVNDALAASKGVLSLAKAGQLEVGEASQVAAQALNAFRLSGDKASVVADVLAAAANSSSSDVHGLSLGLSQVAAVANEFGISLEDTATALAVFSNRGVQGSDAGTSLKTMLISLVNPSKEATGLMKQLGINMFNSKGQFIGLGAASEMLNSKMKNLTQEQRNAALATIFGTDAFRAAAFLAGSAGGAYDQMRESIGKVGAATDLAAAQNAGFNGALDNLRSTLETVGTDFGMKLLPPLTEFLKFVSDKIPVAVQALEDTLSALGGKISGYVSNIVKNLGEGKFEEVGTQIGETIKKGIAAALTGISISIDAAKDFFGSINWVEVGSFIVTKIIPGIAIGLLKGLGDLDIVEDILKPLGENIVPVLLGILGLVLAPAKLLGPLTKIIAKIPFAGPLLNKLIEGIRGLFEPIRKAFADLFGKMFSGGKNWFAALGQLLKGVLDSVLGYFSNFGPNIGMALRFAFEGAINTIANFIRGIPLIIKSIFQNIGQVIGQALEPVVVTFRVAFTRAWEAVQGVFINIGGWFAERWANIQAVFSYVGQWFTAIFQWAINGIQAVWGNIGVWFAQRWASIQGIFAPVGEWFGSVFRGAWNVITSVFGNIGGWFRARWDDIVNALGGPANAIKNTFVSIGENIKSGIVNTINWVVDKINGMIDAVNKVASKVPGAPTMGKINRLASGTPSYTGGLTMVGERGPELVSLPQGTRVMSATQTRQELAGGRGGGVQLNIDRFEVHNNMDIGRFAREIAWQMAVRG